MSVIEENLISLLQPVIEDQGFELVRLRVTGKKQVVLQIMAERPDGTMTAQNCADLSRVVAGVLEEADPIEAAYTLEVSSPGIDRPLTRLKDFERWQGFAAKLELVHLVENRKRFKGVLAGIDGENICFDIEGEEETALIPFHLIAKAQLILTDDLVRESLRAAKEAEKNSSPEPDASASLTTFKPEV